MDLSTMNKEKFENDLVDFSYKKLNDVFNYLKLWMATTVEIMR